MRGAGLVSGRARLAVASGASTLATPCRYTGLCMYGCPYGSIYNAATTLRELVDSGRVDYRPGRIVDRLEETGGVVRVRLRPLGGGGTETLSAERVFVAGGVLGSTRIVLDSLEAYARPVPLLESAYYTLPLVTWRRTARVGRGLARNTLAQIFLELDDREISAHGVHVQVYGYSARAAALCGRLLALRRLPSLVGRARPHGRRERARALSGGRAGCGAQGRGGGRQAPVASAADRLLATRPDAADLAAGQGLPRRRLVPDARVSG